MSISLLERNIQQTENIVVDCGGAGSGL